MTTLNTCPNLQPLQNACDNAQLRLNLLIEKLKSNTSLSKKYKNYRILKEEVIKNNKCAELSEATYCHQNYFTDELSYIFKQQDFTNCTRKERGISEGSICEYNGTKYLIKPITGGFETGIADISASYIINMIRPGTAAQVYLTEGNDGSLSTASKFIDGFVTINDYQSESFKVNVLKYFLGSIMTFPRHSSVVNYIQLIGDEILYGFGADHVFYANTLANFVYQTDYHTNNIGFIVNQHSARPENTALIDFDSSRLIMNTLSGGRYPKLDYFAGINAAYSIYKKLSSFDLSLLIPLKGVFYHLKKVTLFDDFETKVSKNIQEAKNRFEHLEIAKKFFEGELLTANQIKWLFNSNYATKYIDLRNENYLLKHAILSDAPQLNEALYEFHKNTSGFEVFFYLTKWLLSEQKVEVFFNLLERLVNENSNVANVLIDSYLLNSHTFEEAQNILPLLNKLIERTDEDFQLDLMNEYFGNNDEAAFKTDLIERLTQSKLFGSINGPPRVLSDCAKSLVKNNEACYFSRMFSMFITLLKNSDILERGKFSEESFFFIKDAFSFLFFANDLEGTSRLAYLLNDDTLKKDIFNGFANIMVYDFAQIILESIESHKIIIDSRTNINVNDVWGKLFDTKESYFTLEDSVAWQYTAHKDKLCQLYRNWDQEHNVVEEQIVLASGESAYICPTEFEITAV